MSSLHGKRGVYSCRIATYLLYRIVIDLHDFRATFVTVNLAHGKTETWISDRTGHRSSQMINTYRRQARTWTELGIGQLAPMDSAIPELVSEPGAKSAA